MNIINKYKWIILGVIVAAAIAYVLFSGTSKISAQSNHIEETCYDCPTVTFDAERYICEEDWKLKDDVCQKRGEESVLPTLDTFSVTFQYEKTEDPTKCHKPTAESLEVPEWARDDFGIKVSEFLDADVIECPVEEEPEISIDRPKLDCGVNYVAFKGDYEFPYDREYYIKFFINGREPAVDWGEGSWST